MNDLPFGFIIFVNDGSGELHIFVCASTGIDVTGLSPGQTIEVTGFSGQFADDFEVDPREQGTSKSYREFEHPIVRAVARLPAHPFRQPCISLH